ncbi:S8 family serine peptidase [Streptomyces sp. NPDC002054]|uniref:S8 family peptidase n=1 Tax=Streptomyces sp. NPDC002054 TaxID=3154663 RepID=UPI003317ABE7
MPSHRNRRTGAAALATAAALALAAGLTTPSAAAPGSGSAATPTSAAKPFAAKQRQQTSPGLTHLTLITGDRVTVDAKGNPVGFRPAKGREKIPVSVQRQNGRTSIVPFDAQRLIEAGRLDPRLFDLTELGRPEYRKARGDRLKLIVRYEGGAAPAAKAGLRATGGTEVSRTFPSLGAEAVTAGPDRAAALWETLTDAQAGTGRRATAAGIATIWLDGIRKAHLDKSTKQIGADKAWAAGYDGKGVKIAVLDTGVDSTHPDLAGQVVAEQNFSAAPDAKDRFGHGTHVASIAAGTGAKSGGVLKGVAPGAKVLNGKVLDDSGSGDDAGILAGMEWAVAQGAQVINMSLGGPDGPDTDPLETAVNKLSADKGVLFAISAGNSGYDGPGSIGSPGSAQAALTVGAVDDGDALADFSSIGPRTGDGAVKPDVTAPGVDTTAAAAPGSVIEREVGQSPEGYLTISGTSMAAPHAAGAAALLKQQHPTWTGADLKGVLTASTKPGAYTPFQQGSGRIAVDRALGQSVFAEPVSLAFAGQPWPHHDDTPETKKLSYRNLGGAPVTLDVAVTATGPDGKPAPAGFLTADAAKVTVPAGGTASVNLTLNTRLGGQVDGAYTAYATATGGGQSTRTAIAVEREVESYNLTVKHLGRNGKPTADYGTTVLGTTGLAVGKRFQQYDASGTVTVRVPKGGYLLNSDVVADPEDFSKGIDWIAQPKLDVTGNTTVTVDARTAKPVAITVPSRTAVEKFAMPTYDVRVGNSGYAFGWWLDSYAPLRTAHMGPAAPAGTLRQQWDAHWQDGANDEYHAALGGPVTRLATGYTRHLKAADLATVSVEQGASATGKQGGLTVLGWLPDPTGASGITIPRPLPATAKLHLSTLDGATWETLFGQTGGTDENGWPIEETTYVSDGQRSYQGGKSYRERYNAAVFGPRVDTAAQLGIYREGNKLYGSLPLLADGAGHNGASFLAKGSTVLYRNGVVAGSSNTELRDSDPFEVPAADAPYKLVTKTTVPSAVSGTSAKVTATWWFRSKQTAEPTQVPASVVRFTPELSLTGTSPAGRTVQVPVTVQGPAAGAGLASLTVQVSYDDGYTWQTLPVQAGKVSVKNPAKGGHVSLRGVTVDKSGNKSDITITRAYLAG